MHFKRVSASTLRRYKILYLFFTRHFHTFHVFDFKHNTKRTFFRDDLRFEYDFFTPIDGRQNTRFEKSSN